MTNLPPDEARGFNEDGVVVAMAAAAAAVAVEVAGIVVVVDEGILRAGGRGSINPSRILLKFPLPAGFGANAGGFRPLLSIASADLGAIGGGWESSKPSRIFFVSVCLFRLGCSFCWMGGLVAEGATGEVAEGGRGRRVDAVEGGGRERSVQSTRSKCGLPSSSTASAEFMERSANSVSSSEPIAYSDSSVPERSSANVGVVGFEGPVEVLEGFAMGLGREVAFSGVGNTQIGGLGCISLGF